MLRRSLLISAFAASLAFAIPAQAAPVKTLKIGVTAGTHAEILRAALPIAKKNGLDIKVIEFQDYVSPNEALAHGDLDANIFQTLSYLKLMNKQHNYGLAPVGKSITEPLTFYSKKYTNLSQLPTGAKIGIPNDPSTEGRSLFVLEQAGLIKLKAGFGREGSPLDVISNPKKLKFVELEAAQVPRSLKDVDIAVVNSNYALGIGLNPLKDSIYLEDKRSPYALVVATRKGDQNDPRVQKLVKALQSPATKKFILTKYKGAVVPSF